MSEDRRDIYWTPWIEAGAEHLAVTFDADGAHADGLILCCRDGRPLRAHYRLDVDTAWRVRHLHLALLDGERVLRMDTDGEGRWTVDRKPAPDLDGCLDVDIQITPFTNTLPIRRLNLAKDEKADLRVAYVPVPDLAVRPVEQRYTCLEPHDPDGGSYRYEGLFRSFAADLPVDPDGLVIDYPETFRRSWPR